jgi:hypothetical protein
MVCNLTSKLMTSKPTGTTACVGTPGAVAALRLSVCMDDVGEWMASNRLILNASKSEILWYGTARRQHQVPDAVVRIGADFVAPSASMRDLGFYLDADVSMSTHVMRSVTVFRDSSSLSVDPRRKAISSRLLRHVALQHSSDYRPSHNSGFNLS